MLPLTHVTYFAAGFIYGMHFLNRRNYAKSWLFLASVLIVFQVIVGQLANSPPIPSSNTAFWLLQTLSGLFGILLALSLSYVVCAPPLFSLSDVCDPIHFIWVLLQLLVWTAILISFEFLSVPWGSLLAAGLFIVWAYVCTQVNQRHCLVFATAAQACVVYGWMTVYLLLWVTLPWTLVVWLAGASFAFAGSVIGLLLGLSTSVLLYHWLRPLYIHYAGCSSMALCAACKSEQVPAAEPPAGLYG